MSTILSGFEQVIMRFIYIFTIPELISFQDYGQIPNYIEDIERELAECRAKFQEFLYSEKQAKAPKKMSEKTKQEIYEVVHSITIPQKGGILYYVVDHFKSNYVKRMDNTNLKSLYFT